MKKLFLLCSALLLLSLSADQVDFLSKPVSAGKASLAENAYTIGFAWRSPQLESAAYSVTLTDGTIWRIDVIDQIMPSILMASGLFKLV